LSTEGRLAEAEFSECWPLGFVGELSGDFFEQDGPGGVEGGVQNDDLGIEPEDHGSYADAEIARGFADDLSSWAISGEGALADAPDTGGAIGPFARCLALDKGVAIADGGIGDELFEGAGSVMASVGAIIGDDHLAEFASGHGGARVLLTIENDADADAFVDANVKEALGGVFAGICVMILGDRGRADVVFGPDGKPGAGFEKLLEGDMVPTRIVADFDDAGLPIDDTADGNADSLQTLVGALEELYLFGDEMKGGFGGGRGSNDDGIDQSAAHGGDREAGFPVLDFDTNRAEVIGELEAGGGPATGGIFLADLNDEILFEQFGDDAGHGSIGEAAGAGEFGPGHGVGAAEQS